jgi:hypothetical protein
MLLEQDLAPMPPCFNFGNSTSDLTGVCALAHRPSPSPGPSPGAHSPGPQLSASASAASLDSTALNASYFDPDAYLRRVLRETRLGELAARQRDMAAEVGGLDSDMQVGWEAGAMRRAALHAVLTARVGLLAHCGSAGCSTAAAWFDVEGLARLAQQACRPQGAADMG